MTDNKQYPKLPNVGPIGYASVVDIDSYEARLSIGPHLPGVRDVALWTTDQMRAYVDADRAMRALQAAPVAQGDALDQGVREELSIGKAINRAARDLPEGWVIRIDLERRAGVVFLIDPDGNETMSEGGELFSDQINAAIDAAIDAAKDAT